MGLVLVGWPVLGLTLGHGRLIETLEAAPEDRNACEHDSGEERGGDQCVAITGVLDVHGC